MTGDTAAIALAAPYDRRLLTPGIVHFGVGRFHRAHLATYLNELFARKEALEWAIRGVGLRPEDSATRDALRAQDCLYSVTEKHPDGHRSTQVIGSIVEFIDGYRDPRAAIEAVADPRTKIVTLTITEGGYNVDHRTGEFRLDEPAVAADLAGRLPRTVFGVVCEGLRRRRDGGDAPLTVLSCDNVQGNGATARRAFTTYARALDPGLGAWIDANVTFPATMVDRITPARGDDELAEVRSRTGLDDRAAVVCEPFRQFVVEDEFAAGRPPWEAVGVQMVTDVQPYEQLKLRLLNASHQTLAHFGLLLGYTHTAQAMRDPRLAALVAALQDNEARPTLSGVRGVDVAEYSATVRERFANPQMDDTLVRIATSASARIPAFVLPVVRDRLAAGAPIPVAAATVAAWLHRLRHAAAPPVFDEITLAPAEVRQMLAHPLFGNLATQPRFVREVEAASAALEHTGVAAVLRGLLGDDLGQMRVS